MGSAPHSGYYLLLDGGLVDDACSLDYNPRMVSIKPFPEFTGLKDRLTRLRLARRLDKVQNGNLGDVKPVGEGIFEMREHFGPGWRMYYVQRGNTLIVMLGGGDKSTQAADIAKAAALAAHIEE